MIPPHVRGATAPTAEQLLGLIETIYAAVQQPELWASVLDTVAEAIHGESLMIVASLPSDSLVVTTRTDPQLWQAYTTYYAGINPLMEACDILYREGEVRYSHQALSDDSLEKTEFYGDFFHPFDMHYSMGVKIPFSNDVPAAYLSCQRPKDSGPFTEREGRVYQTLMPHLQRALMLHLQLTQMQSRMLGMQAAVEAYDHAVLALDRRGRVVLASLHAENLLRDGTPLRLKHGRLVAGSSAEDKLLQTAIAAAIGDPASAAAAVRLQRASGVPLQVAISPYRQQPPGATALAALVFLNDPSRQTASRAALLASLYRLTPTETRLADLLADGLNAKEIADQLRIGHETVRFHTKRILSKTGSRRQVELMKLMLSLPRV